MSERRYDRWRVPLGLAVCVVVVALEVVLGFTVHSPVAFVAAAIVAVMFIVTVVQRRSRTRDEVVDAHAQDADDA